jgi:hypothetical protein
VVTMKTSSKATRSSHRRHSAGVVLPVVLVILTVLTGLVVTQVRRSAIDERLAHNTRESVMLDDAAQTALRFCEWRVLLAPLATAFGEGLSSPPTPAWAVATNWTDTTKSFDFTGIGLMGGMGGGDPACVIENATCELAGPIGRSDEQVSGGGCNGIHERWMKVRITSKVSLNAPDLPGGVRDTFSQSEIRMLTD